MVNRLIAGSTIAAVLLMAASALADTPEQKFVGACEHALQQRLKAPSTYKRVSVDVRQEDLTINEYAAGDQAVFDWLTKNNASLIRHIAVITYDASNSFGVPIRSVAKCTSDTVGNDGPTYSPSLVKLDGYTNIEWAAVMLAKSRR